MGDSSVRSALPAVWGVPFWDRRQPSPSCQVQPLWVRKVDHRALGLYVERRRGFVSQDDDRIIDERPGPYPLRLTTREILCKLLRASVQAEL